MTVVRGFAITLASGIAFAIFGALAGYGVALYAPDYYRLVFGAPDTIDLRQLGVVLGFAQGGAVGLLIGAVVVVSVGLYSSRIQRRSA